MRAAAWLVAAALLALAACRTPTYDERMAEVDRLYSRGEFEAAAAELDRITGGRISGEGKEGDGDSEE